MPSAWLRPLVVLPLLCSLLSSVASGVAAQDFSSTTWSEEALSAVRPLVRQHLARRDPGEHGPIEPLLALGLEAYGASDGATNASMSRSAPTTSDAMSFPPLAEVCVTSACDAPSILERPELWRQTSGPADGPASVATLDPAFRRMALALFDRDALLFHSNAGAREEVGFDTHLNAIAFAALTRMIDALPAESMLRLEYVALYREMARAITRLQSSEGWWRQTLGDDTTPHDPAASALIVFALTWGLNTGMLSFNEGETAALRGWDALSGSTQRELWTIDDAALGSLLLAATQIAGRQW